MTTFLARFQDIGKPPASQPLARLTLGSVMSFADVTHLTTAWEELQAQVTDWFCLSKDAVVIGSGIAEIGLGAGLLTMPGYLSLTVKLDSSRRPLQMFPDTCVST